MAGEGATNGAVGSWQRSREQHTTLGKEGRNMQRARRSTLGKEGHTRQGGAQYIESTLHWAKSSTICREYYWAKRGTLGKEEHTVQRAKLGMLADNPSVFTVSFSFRLYAMSEADIPLFPHFHWHLSEFPFIGLYIKVINCPHSIT